MIKISKTNYDKGIKYTEIIILLLFTSSAILMSISQDKLMKSTEITLKNMENFEVILLSQNLLIKDEIDHLISCDLLDRTKEVKEIPLELLENVKEACTKTSLERMINSSRSSMLLMNASMQSERITKGDSENYRIESEKFSKLAIFIFIAGVILCFFLILDMHIFEPDN